MSADRPGAGSFQKSRVLGRVRSHEGWYSYVLAIIRLLSTAEELASRAPVLRTWDQRKR